MKSYQVARLENRHQSRKNCWQKVTRAQLGISINIRELDLLTVVHCWIQTGHVLEVASPRIHS